VKRYDPAGGFDCVVAGAELFRPGTVGLDLAVDEQDRILVLDPVRRVVRIFERK
jgi:predicted ribosome-associated RNA-binding protein Tma20